MRMPTACIALVSSIARVSSIALAISCGWPGAAVAAEMQWQGTLTFELGPYDSVHIVGSGAATLATDTSGVELAYLRLAGGLTGSTAIPITDPDVAGTFPSVRITPRLGTGTLGPFWPIEPWPDPQLTKNTLPLRGLGRLCTFASDCTTGLFFPLSRHGGEVAVGVGGLLTAGGFGDTRLSISGAPWTLFTATLGVRTSGGETRVTSRTGWIHGAFSSSGAAALSGAALQLVTPLEITGRNGLYLPGFAYLTLKFIPEPGLLLLLSAGGAGLVLLGRDRIRS